MALLAFSAVAIGAAVAIERLAVAKERPRGKAALGEVLAWSVLAMLYSALILLLVAQPPAHASVTDEGAALIERWEIGSVERYDPRPIWPGHASGVTWGIGYDGGHQRATVIAHDWTGHADLVDMLETSGVTGPPARDLAARVRQAIYVTLGEARAVYRGPVMRRYVEQTRRAFGPAFDAQTDRVKDALVSLVFNRGPAMTGPNRSHMRHIRDVCLPARDDRCTASQIRVMAGIWRGSTIERGMRARREDEARHIEGGDERAVDSRD